MTNQLRGIILALTFTLTAASGCATMGGQQQRGAKETKRITATTKKPKNARLRDYSLFRKGDLNRRILRKGQKARYSNALDSI